MLALRNARLTDVVSQLRGFAITSFDVPVEALAKHLPSKIRPEVVTLDDGRQRALISAVTFLNTDFHVRYAPFVRLKAAQTNFRAYVRRGDEHAVWFFGTTLGSRFVVLPRVFWRLPWAFGRHQLALDAQDGRCRSLSFHADSEHGVERLDAVSTGRAVGRLDGFVDAASTSQIVLNPFVGYLRRRDGRYVTYAVDHAPLELEYATASNAKFELFERLGLTTPDQAPHSVFVTATSQFHVRLPPRRVELDDPG